MALPSQMPRTPRQAGFRPADESRSKKSGAFIVAALIVAAALGVWWWFARHADTTPAPAIARDTAPGPVPNAVSRTAIPNPAEPTRKSSEPIAVWSGATATPSPQSPTRADAASEPPPVRAVDPVAAASTREEPAPLPADPPTPARDPALERLIASADSSIASGRTVEARGALNRALHHPGASPADAAMLRRRLADLNETLVFSPTVAAGDPLSETYVIQPGDRLITIARSHNVNTDWRFLQRVNRLSDPGRLRVGQKLKLVKGPFHAVITKRDYRLDLYANATDPDGNRLYIRSFPVGLGEYNSTPIGKWVVRPGSKLINPHWVNPRTGQRFASDDPLNPIGEHWIGLTGVDPNTEVLSGYGLHGTIEPQSIGQDASMGCVRMLPADIELLYELLVDQQSQVEIRP